MRKLFYFSIIALCTISQAQQLEFSFEDNSFSEWVQSESNHWHLDSLSPIAGKRSLHHSFDNSSSGTDQISVPHEQLRLDSSVTNWQFSVRYAYNPSSGNNFSCWLVSEKDARFMTPMENNNGYILGVNYSGSDDFIKLWRQDGTQRTAILTTSFNWQENISPGTDVKLRATRSESGKWQILVDTSDTFVLIGEGSDNTYKHSEHFGIYYRYTSSQDRKLWVDDITISGKFYTDTLSPQLVNVKVLDRNTLHLIFSEPIDTAKTLTLILNQVECQYIDWITSKEAFLSHTSALLESNRMVVKNLFDIKGNVAEEVLFYFNHFEPGIHDIIITEIMADPNPAEELPECEYIELYNASVKPFNIKGFQFICGDRTPFILPDFKLEAGTFVVITDASCSEEFSGINIIAEGAFPAIPNSGEELALNNQYGENLYSVAYNDDWYGEKDKEEGGWALEMIDTRYPCLGQDNWQASNNINGGTPGKENSHNGGLEQYPFTKLVRIDSIGLSKCKLLFSGKLDTTMFEMEKHFQFNRSEKTRIKVNIDPKDATRVSLTFEPNLEKGKAYSLHIMNSLADCSGESVTDTAIVFGVPELADSASVIINEIMFEANEDMPEFIELYNNSNKVIDIESLGIATIDEYNSEVVSEKDLAEKAHHFFPGEYLVITEDKQLLSSFDPGINPFSIVEPESWLTLSNNGGLIAITGSDGNAMELAVFNPDLHFPLIHNTKGVSLERISKEQAGTNTNNWHSASGNRNYATPGRENSQSGPEESNYRLFSVDPLEISPDNDGYQDYCRISYQFPKPGFMLRINIYSQQGVFVGELVNNELSGLSGKFQWDGLDVTGGRLPMGYYILNIEAWHVEGDRYNEKKVVLLLPEKK
jgi:hypothetical protein